MELTLYVEDGDSLKALRVPHFVVKDLVRDRLSESEINRIHRLAEPVKTPSTFKAGSVIVNFAAKTARCFDARIDLASLEPTWTVTNEKITLENY